ncbi:hypothetical protein Vafri_1362 [Volvox africanus]|nr:hypothetical protein Vafri_1362 [Volvox africanus]
MKWIATFLVALLLHERALCLLDHHVQRVGQEQYLEAPIGVPQMPREEWDAFLSENLARDIAPWQARVPLSPADVLLQHKAILEEGLPPENFQLILIYNNRLYYPNRNDKDGSTYSAENSPAGIAFYRKVTSFLSSGRRSLPNALFVFSFEDNRPRFCSPSSKFCKSVPMFSQFKTLGEPDGDDLDILLPQWLYTPNSMYFYPWHLKKDLAFFRGEPFCSGYWAGQYRCFDACPRISLAQQSHRDKESGNCTVLDVRLVTPVQALLGPDGQPQRFRCLKKNLPSVPRVSIPGHSFYKWLLHMEGITASSRLSQLMLINSVVVMQRQAFIEYFYRSLKPYVHYVPFWNVTDNWAQDDIYEVIRALREKDISDPSGVQQIVHDAQSFALRFTAPLSRFQYLKDALNAYRGLFNNTMDDFIETYVSELRQRGFNIPLPSPTS